jgi:hypothetical protein
MFKVITIVMFLSQKECIDQCCKNSHIITSFLLGNDFDIAGCHEATNRSRLHTCASGSTERHSLHLIHSLMGPHSLVGPLVRKQSAPSFPPPTLSHIILHSPAEKIVTIGLACYFDKRRSCAHGGGARGGAAQHAGHSTPDERHGAAVRGSGMPTSSLQQPPPSI